MTLQEGQIGLKVIPPKGGQPSPVAADVGMTGKDLKDLVQDIAKAAPETLLLFFQNGSRNAAKVAVDDAKTLAEQGIEDDATITIRVNEAEVSPGQSALRQSIAKSGGSSYYYAHANEKALPSEHRYVYGGAPAKLDDKTAEEAAVAQQESAPAVPISKYSWADEGDFVCIYVSAEAEGEALAAAGDGKGGQVSAEFGVKTVELRIKASPRDFALVLRNLENELVPEECKHRVSAGKRVTLKLRKRRQVTWSRLVKPS